jgi:GDP/UDP-N,N'-diacetylbacillosamine 2-epimerase (hydrolysing)
MSHLHFTATQAYKNRVIQLGENPNRVFNVGGLGIDNIKKLELLSKDEFEKSINFKLKDKNILFTYHPETIDEKDIKTKIKIILEALQELECGIIFTKANSDNGGRVINKLLEEFVSNHKNCVLVDSLGQLRYLSALQFVDAVVGNSSSGIIEVPSFNKWTINIGNRQKGRIRAKSIIDVDCNKLDILNAMYKAFNNSIEVDNPYQKEKYPSKKVVQELKKLKINSNIKRFYEVDYDR